jgi:Fe-Mn family superoxide dismutase
MFTLSALPFVSGALEPHILARTLEFHHGKHHQAYLDNLNKLVTGTEWEAKSLEEIIRATVDRSEQAAIFNNAAQVYNHNFFWLSLRPAATASAPSGALLAALEASFGSLEAFYEEFKKVAVSQFGSGWAWLVKEGETLKIIKTVNADTPLARGLKPLLTVDVWEHAYYLDYQNRRADFIEAVIKNLWNWEFAQSNF